MKKKNELPPYTNEEIESIKKNLKIAFGIDYIPLNNRISELYKNKKFTPKEGDILHVHLPFGNDEFDLKRGWYRIKVTYVRSGVMFFKYIDTKHKRKEGHACIESEFIERAFMGTIRMNEISIPERNLPLVKVERDEHDPFPVELLDENGKVITIL
jgi:hypothetical protein